MTSPDPTVLRVTSPRALIESIPHLLGFVPVSSLVFVLSRSTPFESRERVVLTVRFDLPLDVPLDAADIERSMATAITSSGATAATVVAFGPASTAADESGALGPFADRASDALATSAQALQHLGLRITDVLVVADARFRSLWCTDEHCCPPGGAALSDAWSSEAAARLAYAGQSMPARARHDLEEAVRADPDRVRSTQVALEAMVSTAVKRASTASAAGDDDAEVEAAVHRLADAIVRFAENGDSAPGDVAAVGWGLLTGRVRDHAVRWIIDAGAGDAAAEHRAFWEAMTRSLPAPFDAPAAALAALAAAMGGDGAAVNIALDRATSALQGQAANEASEVFGPLVTNLEMVLRTGWPPDRVVEVLATAYRRFDPLTRPIPVAS